MRMPHLTDELAAAAIPRPKDYFLWDSDVPGLALKVTPKGLKTFVLQWRVAGDAPSSRRRRIGRFGAVSVDEARAIAQDARRIIADGTTAGTDAAAAPLGSSSGYFERAAQPTPPPSPEAAFEAQLGGYFSSHRYSRNKIMAAATRTFMADGFETSLDAIARAAGVTRPTVYRHFGSKEALFRAVVGAISAEIMPDLCIDRDQPPFPALLAFARGFRAAVLGDRQTAFYRLAVSASGKHMALFQEAGILSHRRTLTLLVAYLRWGMEGGRFRPVDPERTSEQFLAALTGFARTRMMLGYAPETPLYVDAYLHDVVEHFLRGLDPAGTKPHGA